MLAVPSETGTVWSAMVYFDAVYQILVTTGEH